MKDETAPKMVLTSPADGSTNVHYNTKEVIVTFDEDIQLMDVTQHMRINSIFQRFNTAEVCLVLI